MAPTAHTTARRRWTERENAAHASITQALAESERTEEFGARILGALSDSLGADVAELWVVEEREMRLLALSGAPGTEVSPRQIHGGRTRVGSGVGLPGKVWKRGDVVVLNGRLARDPLFARGRTPRDLRSGVGLPLVDRGRVIGALVVLSRGHLDPDDEELAAAATICTHAAEAMGRLHAFEVLRESERSFRLLFDANPMPMWVYDLATLRFIAVNDAAVAHYGYSRDQFLSRSILEIGLSEDVPALLREIAGDGAGGRGRTVWRHLRSDGTVLHAEITSHRTEFAGRQAVFVMAHDVSRHRELEASLLYEALHDPLTGLANRRLFVDRTALALKRARAGSGPVAALAVDIHGLRALNRVHGRMVTDLALIEVARRLDSLLGDPAFRIRSGDVVGRLGPGDFYLLCSAAGDPEAAGRVADHVVARMAEPIDAGGRRLQIGTAIGIALSGNGAGDDAEGLIAEAETALSRAKERGPGSREVFGPEMRRSLSRRVALERGLTGALDRGQLSLLYQPKVSLETGTIVGVEALVRWHHPDLGVVPPAEFIPLAEESGLIISIGAWVLEEACRAARRSQTAFPDRPPLTVSVNVSSRQFQAQLGGFVASVLARTGVDPGALCLELTETTVMGDVEAAIAILGELKRLGVRISIDDFGTGYSSLAYLRRFPLDELKVDRSFVDGLGRDPEATAIVAAVVATAHALDLNVVGEGVETEDQLTRLRSLGCDEVQGFHIARPATTATVDDLVAREADAGLERRRRRASLWGRPVTRTQEVALVVDDDGDTRQLLRMTLAAAGFEVHEAAGGAEALRTAAAVGPDCLVMEAVLPGTSGLEVLRRLREGTASRDTTVVMVTDAAAPSDKAAAFALDVDDYIVKPFDPRDMVRRLRAAMRRRLALAETARR